MMVSKISRPADTSLGLAFDKTHGGRGALAVLLKLAEQAIASLPMQHATAKTTPHGAAVACLRGTGPGVSFKELVSKLESEFPIELQYPFEENERVGGGVWPATIADPQSPAALMKLHWQSHADDLPMHCHQHSDRCLIVLDGRGFFHVSDEPVDAFLGTTVQTVAARERDVFFFTREIVHTFSTTEHPMTLLSCHLPFVPLDDPRQYTLPAMRWTAREHLDPKHSQIVLRSGSLLVDGRRVLETAEVQQGQ